MTPLEARLSILEAFGAGVVSVDPRAAVRRVLTREGRSILLGEEAIEVAGSVLIAALGKAAPGMSIGALDVIGDLVVDGVVVSAVPADLPHPLRGFVGEHPRPGAGSAMAGRGLLDLAQSAGHGDVVLALVSGGGSALVEAPIGLTVHALGDLVDALMAVGAPIADLNVVRRHLSRVKNGGLARAAAPARVVTLAISDVVDGPVSDIASGPTIPDSTTPEDALRVVEAYLGDVPRAVQVALCSRTWEPSEVGSAVVVADRRAAMEGARVALAQRGEPVTVISDPLEGEAAAVARRVLSDLPPGFSIRSGETTVSGATGGTGGRNQEAALAAAATIAGRDDVVFGALGTDGIDGASSAAGAIVDGTTLNRGPADLQGHLVRHESGSFLARSGDIVTTGPTGTNVGDLWIAWRG